MLFALEPELEWDSYITIGLLDSADNALQNIGIDFTDFVNGNNLYTSNGSWFITPDDEQGVTMNGRDYSDNLQFLMVQL